MQRSKEKRLRDYSISLLNVKFPTTEIIQYMQIELKFPEKTNITPKTPRPAPSKEYACVNCQHFFSCEVLLYTQYFLPVSTYNCQLFLTKNKH